MRCEWTNNWSFFLQNCAFPNDMVIFRGYAISQTFVYLQLSYNYINIKCECKQVLGITKEKIYYFGYTIIFIKLEDDTLHHKFQIISQDIPIDIFRILGRDFLQKFDCDIDNYTYTLHINTRNNDHSLPIIETIVQHIHIPAKSEIIIP